MRKLLLLFGLIGLIGFLAAIDVSNRYLAYRTGYVISPYLYHHHAWLIDEETNAAIIGSLVVDYSIKGDYLLVLRYVVQSVDCLAKSKYAEGYSKTIKSYRSDEKEYWIINYKTKQTVGAYDLEGFIEMQKQLSIPNTKLNSSREYHPTSGTFEDFVASCIAYELT